MCRGLNSGGGLIVNGVGMYASSRDDVDQTRIKLVIDILKVSPAQCYDRTGTDGATYSNCTELET